MFNTIIVTVATLMSLLAVSCAAPGSEPSAVVPDTPRATIPSTEIAPPPPPQFTETLTVPVELLIDALGNATYHGILDEPVTLTGGRYEGAPFVEGDASHPVVILLTDPVAYGDLDSDGRTDAAAVLVSDSGGSGTFLYLAAVQSRDSEPANTATLLLGDREQVRSLAFDGERLLVTLLSHDDDDPACCPTVETVREFTLEGETLVEVE